MQLLSSFSLMKRASIVILVFQLVEASDHGDFCVVPAKPYLIVMAEDLRLRPDMKVPFGTEVSAKCATGHIMITGSLERVFKTVCQETGQFYPPFGRCIPVCKNVPAVENGRVFVAEIDEENGQQVRQVICDNGYRMAPDADEYIYCSDRTGGKWTAPNECLKICGRLPAIPNGIIVTVNGSPSRYIGATRRVVCDNGYILSGPSTVTCGDDGNWHFTATCWQAGKGSTSQRT